MAMQWEPGDPVPAMPPAWVLRLKRWWRSWPSNPFLSAQRYRALIRARELALDAGEYLDEYTYGNRVLRRINEDAAKWGEDGDCA
jgi:hypothetical protein